MGVSIREREERKARIRRGKATNSDIKKLRLRRREAAKAQRNLGKVDLSGIQGHTSTIAGMKVKPVSGKGFDLRGLGAAGKRPTKGIREALARERAKKRSVVRTTRGYTLTPRLIDPKTGRNIYPKSHPINRLLENNIITNQDIKAADQAVKRLEQSKVYDPEYIKDIKKQIRKAKERQADFRVSLIMPKVKADGYLKNGQESIKSYIYTALQQTKNRGSVSEVTRNIVAKLQQYARDYFKEENIQARFDNNRAAINARLAALKKDLDQLKRKNSFKNLILRFTISGSGMGFYGITSLVNMFRETLETAAFAGSQLKVGAITGKQTAKGFVPGKKEYIRAYGQTAKALLNGVGLAIYGLTYKGEFERLSENLILFASAARIAKGGKTALRRLSPSYRPMVHKARAQLTKIKELEAGLQRELKSWERIKTKRAKVEVRKIEKLQKTFSSLRRELKKVIDDPVNLHSVDYNPLTEAAKLLKVQGKKTVTFHTTAAKINELTGQKVKTLKSTRKISAQLTSKKKLKTPSGIGLQRVVINFFRQSTQKIVIGGARAQNVFSKKTRKTKDFDIYVSNPKKTAMAVYKYFKDKYDVQVAFFELKGLAKGTWRVKVGKTDLLDISPLSKAVKEGIKPVTVNGLRYANPAFLLKKKIVTAKDIRKTHRFKKDVSDIKRLINRASDKAIFNIRKNPKKVLEVVAKPKNMGASRIKYGETQLFVDFEIATGYALSQMVRSFYPKRFLNLVNKVSPVLKKKLAGVTFLKSRQKITVLQFEMEVAKLPKALKLRAKKAAKGQLSASQSNALRRAISSYINKNKALLKKLSVPSRTVSKGRGERELVLREGARPRVQKKQIIKSLDPTYLIPVNIFRAAASTPAKLKIYREFFKRLTKEPFKEFRRRFRKTDFETIKKYQRAIARAEKLSKPLTRAQKKEMLTFVEKIRREANNFIKNKRATSKKPSSKSKTSKKRTSTKKRKTSLREKPKPSVKRAAANSRSEKTHSRRLATQTRGRIKPRTHKNSRTAKPERTRKNSTRVRGKPSTRKKSRVTTRGKPRSKPRPRAPARTLARPRAKARPLSRPRVKPLVKVPPRYRPPRRILPWLKKKRIKKSEEKELKKWFYSVPNSYRPSLIALIEKIKGVKPRKIGAFKIRPIIK